ncbi:MAG: tetratricopeptide repeat protein [Verrucomicrobiales bacterium]
MAALLQAGLDENLPAPAIMLVRQWMRQNLPKDARMLGLAARAAQLSGDAKEASALYQQFLKLADPKSAEASDAITALHGLLLNQLADPGTAYAFARAEAERLAVNPRFRQYDRWFLDLAKERQDAEGVAIRLLAIIKAGAPQAELVTFYDGDFRWLLETVDGYVDRPGSIPLTQDLFDAITELAAVIKHDEEMKLRLDWAASVKAYNLSLLGDDTKRVGKRKRKQGPAAETEKLEPTAAPIAEATALLTKYPGHAKWVQDGWAGGGNGPYYRGDPKKYWTPDIDAKMAPILAAFPKLSPLQQADLLQSWKPSAYSGFPDVGSVKAVRDFLAANPALMNSRDGLLILDKEWNKLTPEEAQQMAPSLEKATDPRASLIRSIAAGGKDLDKVMAALLGPEVWRLGPNELNGPYADLLWHYCGRPGEAAKRDAEIAKAKALAATFAAGDVKKEDPADKRLAALRMLWVDFKSSQPKIPAVFTRLVAVLKVTPEAVPELLKDASPEAQILVRDALAAGLQDTTGILERDDRARGISSSVYSPWFSRLIALHGGLERLKQSRKEWIAPHPMEPALRAALAAQLPQGKVEPWLVMAWINTQFPENNAESVKLMQTLFQSPVWKTLPTEARFAARSWFKENAMTPAEWALVQSCDPAKLSQALLALPKEADTATTVAALKSTIEALTSAPMRVEIQGLEQLAAVSDEVFTAREVQALILELVDSLHSFEPTRAFGDRLLAHALKQADTAALLRLAPYLWRQVERVANHLPTMLARIDSLADDQPSAANALASTGLGTIDRYRTGHLWFKRESDVPRLRAARSKTAVKLGLVVIPVTPDDPTFPVYQSQADWLNDNEDSAWNLLDANWEHFLKIHRELSFGYQMWTLRRTIIARDDLRQEALIKSLRGWSSEPGCPLTAVEKAMIEMAYGDIAVQRGQLPEAKEIFSRIQTNEANLGLPVRHQAALRVVAVLRLAKDYDGALKAVTELEMERVPEIWSDVRYARAEVHFANEDFESTKADVESILARDSNHADSRILLGKVQLKLQKLMDATELEFGSTSSQDALVPGEKLKVTLNDPTLAVSGAGTAIEVVVWAVSGDKETFFLRQFGDQKTKFRGEVATALGAPVPGDGTLQVIGDDEVFYAYAESFRERMNQQDEKRGGPITIASDSMLMASARKLLTEAEQRTADLNALMETVKDVRSDQQAEKEARKKMAARALDADARAERSGEMDEEEFGRFLVSVVKPGNPINVRVIDPDRSRTAGVDELAVGIASSSGDSISRIVLKETGTHTGWFEGSVPTAGAQAMAFARASEPGRNPNMVISPVESYPAWKAAPDRSGIFDFTVDLNDNHPIGQLDILAAEPGTKLKKFMIQTGMNPQDMTTVAAYPRHFGGIPNAWRPSVTIMNDADRYHNNNDRSVYDLGELGAQIDRGWMTQQFAAGIAENVAGPSAAMDPAIPAKVKWLRNNQHHNAHVVYRFRGYFHEAADVMRRFKLELGPYKVPAGTHPSVSNPPQFLLAVNGKPITSKEKPDELEGEIELRRGLQRFEIWATGWDCTIGFGRSIKLLANLSPAGEMVDCPDNFFDPTTFPAGLLEHRNAPATLTPGDDGTRFTVKFAPDSRARLIRLVFLEQEGPVPALNKITMTTPDGKKLLPVKEDFAALNKNETLEILGGDKIAVRYIDDRFVTKTKANQERFLTVSFADAKVEFADMTPRFDSRKGEVAPYYERLLRFRHNEPLALAVFDADMDVTVQPDKLKVSLTSQAGGTREFEAMETGDSTGIFKLVITPVPGTPAGEGQFQVAEGGTISVIYRDIDNNRPGVPTDRLASIEHAAFTKPVIRVAHAEVSPLPAEEAGGPVHLHDGFWRNTEEQSQRELASMGLIQPRWKIDHRLLSPEEAPEGGVAVVHGREMYLEVVAPQLALGVLSEIKVYAQTDSGRKAGGGGAAGFDITVPGTMELTGILPGPLSFKGARSNIMEIPSYAAGPIHPSGNQLTTDRFLVSVPLIAAMLPDHGVVPDEEKAELRKRLMGMYGESAAYGMQRGLVVRPGDRVHLGFRYQDAAGAEQWAATTAKVITHPVLDVMADDYRTKLTSAFVGETLYLRVVDLGADTTDNVDALSVTIQAKSGAKGRVELRESGPHTGIFRGGVELAYVKAIEAAKSDKSDGSDKSDKSDPEEEIPPTISQGQTLAVIYDDTVAVRYTDANGLKTDTHLVTISKGADGSIEPFSKIYQDQEVAMRTQFSMAEAYLELAKRHRLLGEHEAAALEYTTAKQLLSSAMEQFTDPETRAQAEYLLGNLTAEEADTTTEPALKETRYRAALSRFLNVTGSYPNTLHASKAQYRIAVIYEALKEPEIAAQEYVKLAYKYPESEFVATSMARLGSHFLKLASAYEEKAKPLLAKGEAEGNQDALFEGQAMQKMAEAEYLKTASIFGRLQERFPGNQLAGQAGLRAGQAFMRARRDQDALDAFLKVVDEENYDGVKIRAQAMYWAGMCYQKLRQQMAAYAIFKRLTYDFPESEWAAFARAQLSQESMINLETNLELERLEGKK